MMDAVPRLTEEDLEQYVFGPSLERGYDYYEQGHVLRVVRRGNRLRAEVAGSQYEPYGVTVDLSESGLVTAYCSCPYDWGGYCKHIIAVLLTYIHSPDEIIQRPNLDTLLADLEQDDLRNLIASLVHVRPDLLDFVEKEIRQMRNQEAITGDVDVDVAAVQRELRADMRRTLLDFERNYYDSYYDEWSADPTRPLWPHLKQARTLLDAGEGQNALTLLQGIMEAWVPALEEFMELDDYGFIEDILYDGVREAGLLLAEALLSVELAEEEKAAWRDRFSYWQTVLDGLGLEVAEGALEQGWDYEPLVRVLEGAVTEKGAWEGTAPHYADDLAVARLNVLKRQGRVQEYLYLAQAEGQIPEFIDMLIEAGRVDEAVEVARGYEHVGWLYPVVRKLAEHGAEAEAVDLAEHGLSLEGSKHELAVWLRDSAAAAGRPQLALRAAEVAFGERFELADYQAAEELAGDEWPARRKRLLAALEEAASAESKIDVYLHEGLVEQAMAAVGGGRLPDTVLLRVLRAARETHPDWAIRQCQRKAEAIMNAGKSGEYDAAVSWLGQAREIYEEHGRLAAWRDYLDGLLDKHSRKYKLVPMLREIR